MAQFVRVASVLFRSEHAYGQPQARQLVLDEVAGQLDSLRGLGLQLVVFSETVEVMGQPRPEHAESLDQPGPFCRLYQQFATEQNCVVAGSLRLLEQGKHYNAVVYFGPRGVLGDYRKSVLTLQELGEGFTPGRGATLVQTPVGRLGGAICFDLNHTHLLRQYEPLKPDILIFPSMFHGGLMQATWAYTCRSYLVSALPFHGGGVLDPFGAPLATTDCYNAVAFATINLDRAMVHLDYNRAHLPAIQRKYAGQIEVHTPANIGSMLITSVSPNITAAEVVREFGLELLDDYLARARAGNDAAR
jgi:hypothetical protein